MTSKYYHIMITDIFSEPRVSPILLVEGHSLLTEDVMEDLNNYGWAHDTETGVQKGICYIVDISKKLISPDGEHLPVPTLIEGAAEKLKLKYKLREFLDDE